MEVTYKNYIISDDKTRINVQTVIEFLASSYWANKRPPEKIKRSVQNSICFGVYDGDMMIGFARIITDGIEWMTGILGTQDAHDLKLYK